MSNVIDSLKGLGKNGEGEVSKESDKLEKGAAQTSGDDAFNEETDDILAKITGKPTGQRRVIKAPDEMTSLPRHSLSAEGEPPSLVFGQQGTGIKTYVIIGVAILSVAFGAYWWLKPEGVVEQTPTVAQKEPVAVAQAPSDSHEDGSGEDMVEMPPVPERGPVDVVAPSRPPAPVVSGQGQMPPVAPQPPVPGRGPVDVVASSRPPVPVVSGQGQMPPVAPQQHERRREERLQRENSLSSQGQMPPVQISGGGVPGRFPEASTRYLTKADIEGKSAADLKIMRNEIFARRSCIFKSPDMRRYFEKEPWYSAKNKDVKALLSNIEKSNVAFLLSQARTVPAKTTTVALSSATLQKPSYPEIKDSNAGGGALGKYPEGSTRHLTKADIEGKSTADLKIMRNEIFARRSYIFKSPDMRRYFEKEPWYSAKNNDVRSMFTPLERENVDFLIKHARP
ncbi:MAG: YARHG domain-containing protein [Pseudomonadota bacterium]